MILNKFAQELKGKTVLITGGTGFFGQNLCEALSKVDCRIVTLSRSESALPGIDHIKHDVTKPFSFEFKADFIIHAATAVYNSSNDFHEIMNVIVNGTQNVLHFASRVGAEKILMISSGAVYDRANCPANGFSEELELTCPFYDSTSSYATGKRISDLLIHEWNKLNNNKATIARCFAFSGKHLPLSENFAIGSFIKQALTQGKITLQGDGTAVRSFMDAKDLVSWLITLLVQDMNGETYNVGSDIAITTKDLAIIIAEQVPNVKIEIQNTNTEKVRENRYIPSIEKAKKLHGLGLTVSLKDSIKIMLEQNRNLNEPNRK